MATGKRVQANGDIETWKIKICGDTVRNCLGVKAVFTLPTGISLTGPAISGSTGIDVPVGSFNPTSKTWFIGELKAGSCTDEVEFEFTVDDITQAVDDKFTISVNLSSDCAEGVISDNDLEVEIEVGDECIEINLSVSGEV